MGKQSKGSGDKRSKVKTSKVKKTKHVKTKKIDVATPIAPHKVAKLERWRLVAMGFDGLRVATDFSGWDTPIMSLRKLGLKFMHVFSSEKSPNLRNLIRANSKPLFLYRDVTARVAGTTLPCDLYIAGPPCQSWSSAGKGKGVRDRRGSLLWSTLDYVAMEKPRVVIIENVRGLVGRHSEEFEQFIGDFRGKGYNVFWNFMDTKHHGIPHSRPRVYMVGFRADLRVRSFAFPEPLPTCNPVSKILRTADTCRAFTATGQAACRIREASEVLRTKGVNMDVEPVFIDTSASEKFAHFSIGTCPCLTFARGSYGGYYVSSLKRKLTLEDGSIY